MPVYGYCNLCSRLRELTWDHVPPQGSTTITRTQLQQFFNKFMITADGQQARYHYAAGALKRLGRNRPRISQNGLKFRTICAECNNKVLGGRYDPEIKRVSEEMGRLEPRYRSYKVACHCEPGRLSISISATSDLWSGLSCKGRRNITLLCLRHPRLQHRS
jgi:hypothetical protein